MSAHARPDPFACRCDEPGDAEEWTCACGLVWVAYDADDLGALYAWGGYAAARPMCGGRG